MSSLGYSLFADSGLDANIQLPAMFGPACWLQLR
jgi:hypothetical protein